MQKMLPPDLWSSARAKEKAAKLAARQKDMKAAQVANKKHMLRKCKKQKCMHAQHFSAQLKLQRTIGKRKAAERHMAELQRIARPLWLPPSLQGE
jgi:hypothetical protein